MSPPELRILESPRFVLLLIISFTLVWTPASVIGENINEGKSQPVRRAYSSLSGEFNITEVDTTRFIGDEYWHNLGRLGSTTLLRDLNADGYDDLILCAPGAPGIETATFGGKAFVWFGGPEILPEEIDLRTSPPNVTINGAHDDSALLADMQAGDFNGDGVVDWALGIPHQPEAGRMYILWGDANWENGTFPEKIDLFNPGRLRPTGSPFGFMRTEEYTIVAGPIGTSVLANYQLANSIEVGDIDGDGIDDLFFTCHGWNNATIFWGQEKMVFGNDLTVFYDPTTSFFGQSIDLGDLDNNGKLDVAVGAPLKIRSDVNRLQCGAVFVHYDAGELRGNSLICSSDRARPIIYGDDDYDRLGRRLVMEDINNDGMDDLIMAAPDSDGPDNNRKGSGCIYCYHGGSVLKFPSVMNAGDFPDVVIYGASASSGDLPGDGLGNSFSIGDMDFDGDKDLIQGISKKSTDNTAWVGSILGYNWETVFGAGKKVDLRNAKERFRFWGTDQEDALGASMDMGDMNGDGADDIVVGSPGADGEDNLRPHCGEAYFLLGSAVSLGQLRMSGPGAIGHTVFAGGGHFSINLSYVNTFGANVMDNLTMVIDPDGENINITFDADGIREIGDRLDMIEIMEEMSSHSASGVRGWFNITMEFGWYVPLGNDVTIRLGLNTLTGDIVNRRYPFALSVVRDVKLRGSVDQFVNGKPVVDSKEWVRPGDEISVTGLSIVYDSDDPKEVRNGFFDLELKRERESVMSVPYISSNWEMSDNVVEIPAYNYSIGIIPELGSPPEGIDASYVPRIGDPFTIPIRVDLDSPSPPVDLALYPDGDREGIYDDDGEWTVGWEDSNKTDPLGSGIHHYLYRVEDGEDVIARRTGGLNGTYYINGDFTRPGLLRTDVRVEFDWGWFGPDNDDDNITIPPYGFSVRWHGWISLDGYPTNRIALEGQGIVRIYLDGNIIMDWSDLSKHPSTDDLGISGFHYIEIYFKQKGKEFPSAISLRYPDGTGQRFSVDQDHLIYPSKTCYINVGGEGIFNVSVRSVDWVGRESSPDKISGINDKTGPYMDLVDFPSWFNNPDPRVGVSLNDPNIGGSNGSGLAEEPLEYRLKGDNDAFWTDWTDEGVELAGENARMNLQLSRDFRGQIQMRSRDAVGNIRESSFLPIGVDMISPEFHLISPDISKVFHSDTINVAMEADDGDGSGVIGNTIEYRMRNENDDWSEWYSLNVTSSGSVVPFTEEILLGYGTFHVQFRGSDLVGNEGISDEYLIKTEEIVVDEPPTPHIRSPVEGARIPEGRQIFLDASGTTDNGEVNPSHLTYIWYSDKKGMLGIGRNISVYLPLGNHTITLYVTDGVPGNNASAKVNITVTEIQESNPPSPTDVVKEDEGWIYILIASIAVLFLLLFGFLILARYRRTEREEGRIDFIGRTEDMDYDRWLEREERRLGIRRSEE